MKKIIIAVLLALCVLFGVMFAEYQYIMHNLNIYRGMGSTIYIEMFGDIHTYYVDYTIHPEILHNN